MKDLPTCRSHGSNTPAAKDKAIVTQVTRELGLPDMPARDWLEHAGQIVARLQYENDRIDSNLEEHRTMLDLDEITVQRRYADIFQAKRDNIKVMTRVAGSVASLSIAKAARDAMAPPPQAPPMERLAEAMAGIAERLDLPTDNHCRTCTCGALTNATDDVVEGEIVEG